jgi:hypothetical protein
MRDLKYKFVSAQNYYANYFGRFPYAPSNADETEFLICGKGDLNEEQMNTYKAINWPVIEKDIL